jgi:flagellar hook-length control protein FliK
MQIAFTKAKIDLISGQDPKQFKVNKKPEGKSFGEVLYREKETGNKEENMGMSIKNDDYKEKIQDTKSDEKLYTEAAEKSGKSVLESENDTIVTEEKKIDGHSINDAEKPEPETENIAEVLAAVYNVSVENFQELLSVMNIEVAELESEIKSGLFTENLLSLLGINVDKNSELISLLDEMAGKALELIEKSNTGDAEVIEMNFHAVLKKLKTDVALLKTSDISEKNTENTVKTDAGLISKMQKENVFGTKNISEEQIKVLEAVKEKITEIIKVFNDDPERFIAGMGEKVKEILIRAKLFTEQSQDISTDTTVIDAEELSVDTESNLMADNKDNSEAKDTGEKKSAEVKAEGIKSELPGLKELNTVKMEPINQEKIDSIIDSINVMDFDKEIEQITKAGKELQMPVATKADIINQVVEQAKLYVTEDKSEMVLQLKPESLGKVALKVITEHGVVTAKFIAESYQVKEVIESSMQTLKQNLQSQGLNVSSIDVSVGQNGGNTNNGARHESRRSAYRPGYISASKAMTVKERQEMRNAYYSRISKINLTA